LTTRSCAAAALTLALAACASDAPPADQAQAPENAAAMAAAPVPWQFSMPDTATMQHSGTGLLWLDMKEGEGVPLQAGQTAVVHYTGWLTNGTKFDSSLDRGEPYSVENVGQASVIPGWNEGLLGMKTGGIRRLVIPPQLGYGASGFPPVIPPNSTLVFDVELVQTQ